jgi:hypothetical protein
MDRITTLPFPNVSPDPIEHDLIEIDAAIALVARGLATRVRLVGLLRPEAAAPAGLAHAQQANVGFSLDRNAEGAATVTLGPRNEGG